MLVRVLPLPLALSLLVACADSSAGLSDGGGAGHATTTSGDPQAQAPKECWYAGLTPPTGPVSCGLIGCDERSICVESYDRQDAEYDCLVHFCVAPPAACGDAPSCDCLEQHLGYPQEALPCVEKDTGLWLVAATGQRVANPPWNDEACPGVTCTGEETCFACESPELHGYWEAPTHECSVENPTVPGEKACDPRAL